jgi:hypothetical protein
LVIALPSPENHRVNSAGQDTLASGLGQQKCARQLSTSANASMTSSRTQLAALADRNRKEYVEATDRFGMARLFVFHRRRMQSEL